MTSTDTPGTGDLGTYEFATEALLDPTAVCLPCLCFNDRTVLATLRIRDVKSGEAMTACVDCDADGVAAESLAHCLDQMAKPFRLTSDGSE
ncbi:hypothetical protein [Kitasatospora purpeofusca]|uniref:hypothetical protein n=1 Tax=Kitasatospora purpeofusca TaxID=67352 RepID=UPI0035DC8F2D